MAKAFESYPKNYRIPAIENWYYSDINGIPVDPDYVGVYYISGVVYNHKTVKDGTPIRTSEVLLNESGYIRTQNSHYILGDRKRESLLQKVLSNLCRAQAKGC